MQNVPELGELIEGIAHRDAVHIAIAPVIATVRLRPGCHVGLDESGYAEISETRNCIGIVDPFLAEWVEPGQKFWLLLYPGTIVSLRHVWTHPAFKARPPGVHLDALAEAIVNVDGYDSGADLRNVK